MTAQVPESLAYDGEKLPLRTTPLAPYLGANAKDEIFQATNTANWRGYVGEWEIADDRLFLVDLKGRLKDGSAATLSTIFPNSDGRVLATWYSGTLRVPQGELIEYVHLGFASRYERDVLIEVREGVIVGKSVQENDLTGNMRNMFPTNGSKTRRGLFSRLLRFIW